MDQIYLLKLHGKLATEEIFAKVSLRWFNQVEEHKWYLGSNGYPFAYIKHKTAGTSRVPLHRYIHWLQKGYWTDLYVDHINRDKLDATDYNLREATAAENSYNKTYTNPNHNIKYNEAKNKFEVRITKDKTIHKIDNIETLDEAHDIYNLMAEELFGKFAPTSINNVYNIDFDNV
jgi:uncharacterized protein YkuJ